MPMAMGEVRNTNFEPETIMRTVKATVDCGLVPQLHQIYHLGRSLDEVARSKQCDPIRGFWLSEGSLLTVDYEDWGVASRLIVQIQRTGLPDSLLKILEHSTLDLVEPTILADEQKTRLTRLMLAVCTEVLRVDLTPKPLYTSPKERGVKSAD